MAEREHAAKDEPKPLDMDDLELDEELDVSAHNSTEDKLS